MKIYERYLLTELIKLVLLALLVLLAIFAFFSLIDQFEQTGQGNYDIWQAMQYVFLTLPHLSYELFPIACVIGSMATLGKFSHQGELVVFRISGVSRGDLMLALCKGGLMLIFIAILVSELIAPTMEKVAQYKRSVALTDQITLQSKYGFWSRDGQSFVNIRNILPGNQVENIYIYEFDYNHELRISTFAKSANYDESGGWILRDTVQTSLEKDGLKRRELPISRWDSLLNPEVINLLLVKPEYLSSWGLIEHIDYLKSSGQNSTYYRQAFWSKVGNPFVILLMIIIAVPLVETYSQSVGSGKRIFLGCIIGVMFHIISQASGHLGVAFDWDPAFSMFLPIICFGVFLTIFMRYKYL